MKLQKNPRSKKSTPRSRSRSRKKTGAVMVPLDKLETSPLIETVAGSFSRRLQEGGFILLGALAIFLLISLFTYDQTDPGWSKTANQIIIHNAAGTSGAWFADLFLFLFGYVAYLFPVMIALSGFRLFQMRYQFGFFNRVIWVIRVGGFIFALLAGCGLANLQFGHFVTGIPFPTGGILGQVVIEQLLPVFALLGSTLLLIAVFLAGVTIATGLSWFGLMDRLGLICIRCFREMKTRWPSIWPKIRQGFYQSIQIFQFFRRSSSFSPSLSPSFPSSPALLAIGERIAINPFFSNDYKKRKEAKNELVVVKTDVKKQNIKNKKDHHSKENKENKDKDYKEYTKYKEYTEDKENKTNVKQNLKLPSVNLLEIKKPLERSLSFSASKLQSLSREVEMRLQEFGVQVVVVGVLPGPVITRFELDLAPGVKVSKISGLAKDLARALSVTRVRVVEVIPGKKVVGLEIPNEHRELVCLRDIIESPQYQEISSPLSLALGKDISGEPVVVDLAKMPHLLVAGTTGSGKSVGVNAMLLSLLYKATPEDVRLILIDPKMLELSIYDGIPHLLTPVVTDMKDAANVLRWCVMEMERRYQLMAALGVRNLVGYNRKVNEARAQGRPLGNPLWKPDMGGECPLLESFPFIVVIIDEFADMMMVVGKKVEELIARIAQKARASGIHMILATQRPSVDVITGLIKANVPTRIAYQVSSRIDSRTILDQQGAEQLLGHGDMLYLAPGTGIPIRIHGAFVSDDEVHTVVKYLKQSGEPDYTEDILGIERDSSFVMKGGTGLSGSNYHDFGDFNVDNRDGEQDDLYDQAVQIVIESRKASISYLQRRLKIGYNRAARLIETMEMAGVVSPMQANGGREVLAQAVME